MEEEHIIPAKDKEPTSKKPSSKSLLTRNKILIVIGVILAFVFIGGAFWFGSSRKSQNTEPSPSPTTEASPEVNSESEADESPSPSPEETSSPSPTPSPTPVTQEETLTATTSLDGFRASNNGGNDSHNIRAGRNIFLTARGFVSFDLSSLPSDITIESATLRLYQTETKGSPYSVGGSLKIDHLNYGDSLGNDDYGSSSLSSSFTTLTSNATVEWKDANVTDRLINDLTNGRSRSQYRIHFQIESIGGDATGDFAYFESAENIHGTGNLPQLVIKYH